MKSKSIPVLDLNAQDRPARKAIFKAVREAILQNAFVLAPVVGQFEQAFAKWVGRKESVGVNSGTAALFLALKAMGVGPGDEVITTPFTFIATLEAVTDTGAKPVLVDIDPGTFCISPAAIQRAITPRTRVILPVHLYGHPADMDQVSALAQKSGAKILEDAAQAHGASWGGKKVGTFGVAAAFSFYPGKNLGAYGDAGAVVTDDLEMVNRLKLLRNHGRHTKYVHEIEGFNERMDGIQAAVLLAKLPFLDRWVRQRQSLAEKYSRAFRCDELNKAGVTAPFVHPKAKHAFHLYVLRVKERERFQTRLKELGVDSAVHYPLPLHLQPCFSRLAFKKGDFQESEQAAEEVLSIPLYPGMTKTQHEKVIRAVFKASAKN